MRTVLAACWGIGLEMLCALAADPRVELVLVLTRLERDDDPYAGLVMNHARRLGLAVESFEEMPAEQIAARLARLDAELLVVHAYPRRLPPEVFGAPRLGTVNVHPSLLPAFPGPDPSTQVLAAGVRETGLTAHFMDQGLDTGPLIHQAAVPVLATDTRETLIERLKTVAVPLMRTTLDRVLDPSFRPASQRDPILQLQPQEKV